MSQDGFGSTWGDYDNDGDLDLFVAGFSINKLFRNNFNNGGNETFTDATGMAFGTMPAMSGFSPRFIDVDGDLWLDLMIVADFGTSHYFKSDGDGTFTDAGDASGTCLEENGMGVTMGDWDANGKMDFYATSIWNGGVWTGNKLYLNLSTPGNHTFVEEAAAKLVDNGGYGWGAVAVDFDHNGLQDIAETNGDSDDSGSYSNQQSYLWIQNDSTKFDEMAIETGFIHYGKGRGLVNFDYDNDGDQDMVLFAYEEQMRLFRNDLSGTTINWLRVFLDTTASPELPPNGVCSVVRILAGGNEQFRPISGGCTHLSQGELSAHFGLGAALVVDEVEVRWQDGTTTLLTDVPANQTIAIASGPTPCPADLDGSGDVGFGDLTQLLLEWGTCPPSCPWDLDQSGDVGFGDLTLLLLEWGPC